MSLYFLNGVSQLECLLRLLLACFFGAMIGVERSRRQKEAGIRTHVIVALGATLMMMVSKYGFFDLVTPNQGGFSGDRIAANIITGVSFLGAGMIFVRGSSIKGLTTAAGIWSTAGIGLAVGAGLYLLAASAAVLIILLQVILHKWQLSAGNTVFGEVVLVAENADTEHIANVEQMLNEEGIYVIGSRFVRLADGRIQLTYHVRAGEAVTAEKSAQIAQKIPTLVSLEVHADL